MQRVANTAENRWVGRLREHEQRLLAQIEQHRAAAEALRRRMQIATEQGSWHRYRKAQRQYLISHSGRVAAVRTVTSRHPRSPDRICNLAERVNPFAECEERVTIRPQRKSPGGYRITVSAGPIRRAGQHLVYNALRPVTPDDPRLWMPAGRGRDRAVARLKHELASGGYEQVVLIDIRDFYGSVSREWLLETLPLPRSVIEHVVIQPENGYSHEDLRPIMDLNSWAERRAHERERRCGNHVTREVGQWDEGSHRSYMHQDQTELTLCPGRHEVVSPEQYLDALRGTLPQGSPVSSLAAHWAAVDILKRCPSDIFVMMYGDNLLALARRGQGDQVRQALLQALNESPSGQFCASQDEARRLNEGFEFLGYQFRLDGDRVDVVPSERNLQKFIFELRQQLAGNSRTRLADARSNIDGWRGAFGEWDQAEDLRRHLLTLVESHRRVK